MTDTLKDMINQAAREADELAEKVSQAQAAAHGVAPSDVDGWPPEAAAEMAARRAAEVEASGAHNHELALKDRVVEALKSIYDPEIPVNIYDLGLIYEINIDDARNTQVVMTLTSPHCPVAESMPAEVEARVRLVPGTADVSVDLTWEPPWNPDSISDEAKLELGMF